jgi:general secretion pathway protein L
MFFYNRATMLIIALPLQAPSKASAKSQTLSATSAAHSGAASAVTPHAYNYHYWLSPNGLSTSLSGQAAPAQLPKNAGEVVAVIPWQCVSWHALKIPAFSPFTTQKLSAVLSGMLEDQLLDDVSALHFILPSNIRDAIQKGQEVVIGACAQDWLRQATKALQDQGITVQRIVCELTPTTHLSTSIQTTDQKLGLTSDLGASTAQSVAPVLHVLGAPSAAATAVLCSAQGVIQLPQSTSDWSAFKALGAKNLKILCEPHWIQSTADTLGREPSPHNVSQRMLAATQSNWDAATGEWQQSRSLRFWRSVQRNYSALRHHPHWSLARKAFISLVILNLVGLNAWSWMQSANLRSREQDLSKLLKETFPAIGLVVDPSLQMQREMRRLQHARGQSAAGDMESMLATIAQALPSNFKLQSFNYSANELKLIGVSKDLVSPLGQSNLQKAGYTVRGENMVIGGQTVPVLVVTFVDAAK